MRDFPIGSLRFSFSHRTTANYFWRGGGLRLGLAINWRNETRIIAQTDPKARSSFGRGGDVQAAELRADAIISACDGGNSRSRSVPAPEPAVISARRFGNRITRVIFKSLLRLGQRLLFVTEGRHGDGRESSRCLCRSRPGTQDDHCFGSAWGDRLHSECEKTCALVGIPTIRGEKNQGGNKKQFVIEEVWRVIRWNALIVSLEYFGRASS